MGLHINTLNSQCPGNAAALVGTRMDALITLANELREKWSGQYDPASPELTWANSVMDAVNEMKTVVNALAARAAETTTKANTAIDLANATKTAFNQHITLGAHIAPATVDASALTVSAASALTITATGLATVTAAAIATLSAVAISLPTINAAAVDVLD